MPATVTVSRSRRGAHPSTAAALGSTRRRPRSVLIEAGTYQESLTVTGDVAFGPLDGPVGIAAADGTTAECSGDVVFRNLALVNYDGTVLRCLSGRLTVEDCGLRGPGKEDACVRTDQGTEVTMRASQVRTGPVYLTGASGVLEDRTLLGSRGTRVGGRFRRRGRTGPAEAAVPGRGRAARPRMR